MPSGSIGSIARTIIVLPSHMIAVGMRVMSGSGQARPSRRAAIKSDSPLNSDIACFECFFGIGQLQTSWAPAVNLRSDPERLTDLPPARSDRDRRLVEPCHAAACQHLDPTAAGILTLKSIRGLHMSYKTIPSGA